VEIYLVTSLGRNDYKRCTMKNKKGKKIKRKQIHQKKKYKKRI